MEPFIDCNTVKSEKKSITVGGTTTKFKRHEGFLAK